MRTLNLTPEHIIAPGHSHLFAAVGAALQAKEETHYTLDEISGKLTADLKIAVDVDRLPPLFASQEDYDAFIKKQEKNKALCTDRACSEAYDRVDRMAGTDDSSSAGNQRCDG